MGNLSNLYVSKSFQSLIHLGSDNVATSSLTILQDGYGNSIGIEVNTAGDLFLSGSLTASLQQGYIYVGNASGKTSAFATSSLVTNVNTGSLVTTSSFNSYTSSNNQRVSSLEVNSASVNTSITNINSATSSLFTSASLALVTASFNNGTRNLTFTKGDNQTFSVNIPDVSGSAGDFVTTASFNAYTQSNDQKVNSLISATGSYATTGSNVFVGNQTISSSLFISGNINMVNGADLVTHHVRAQGSNGLELQTSAGTNIVQMGAGGGTQAVFVGALSANSFSSSTINGLGNPLTFSTSVDSRLDGLEASTSSLFTSASLALVTASVNVNVITFTKGDASTFDLTVSASGSAPAGTVSSSAQILNYGIFATTGSNTFRGNQTITGSVDVSGSAKQTFNAPTLGNQTDLVVVKGATINGVPFNQQTISFQNYDFGSDAYKNAFVIEAWDSLSYNFGGELLVNGETAQFLAVASGSASAGTRQGVIGVFDNGNQKVKAVLSGQIIEIGGTGTAATSVTTVDSITIGRSSITSVISGSLNIQNTLTASLQSGHVLVGNASGRTTTVATSSFGGGTIATGSFATTGSNSFIGNQTITGSLTVSGSVTIQGDTTFVNKSGNTSNVILGSNAMTNITGNVTSNVAIGAGAMRYTSGSTQCVAIGANALGITTGSNNFAIGAETLASNTTGNQNVAIGVGALNNNKTGNLNTAIGNDSGFRNVSGSRNVYIGPNAGNDHYGDNTIIIGGYSGGGLVLNNNIILSDGNSNIKAQYSGSAWSFQDEIKLNKGSNKPSDIVSVNSSLTVSNSLVTTDSIILLTTQNGSVGGTEYPAVVMNKGAGTFDIVHNYGGSLNVAYLIINPT